jgi:hypothetical protein
MLQPVFPEEKRARLAYMLTEKLRQQFEQDKRDKIQAAKDEIQHLKEHGVQMKEAMPSVDIFGEKHPRVYFKGVSNPHAPFKEQYKQLTDQENYIKSLSERILSLERSQPPRAASIPRTLSSPTDIRNIQRMAIEAGMGGSEVEQLIEWEVKPLEMSEKDMLARFAKHLAYPGWQFGLLSSRTGEDYTTVMRNRLRMPESSSVTDRMHWQTIEVQLFISDCFRELPRLLAKEPIKVPSGKYEETLRVERTQQDLINETAMELSALPRFTAYAKAIEEQSGTQMVWKRKIQTLPLPSPLRGAESEAIARENGHLPIHA